MFISGRIWLPLHKTMGPLDNSLDIAINNPLSLLLIIANLSKNNRWGYGQYESTTVLMNIMYYNCQLKKLISKSTLLDVKIKKC